MPLPLVYFLRLNSNHEFNSIQSNVDAKTWAKLAPNSGQTQFAIQMVTSIFLFVVGKQTKKSLWFGFFSLYISSLLRCFFFIIISFSQLKMFDGLVFWVWFRCQLLLVGPKNCSVQEKKDKMNVNFLSATSGGASHTRHKKLRFFCSLLSCRTRDPDQEHRPQKQRPKTSILAPSILHGD